MRKIKFASPTFLFRHECPNSMESIMKEIAACGFDGLELYSMFGHSAKTIAEYCKKTNLLILCDHIHYDEFSTDTENVIKSRSEIGAKYLTIDNIPNELLPGAPGFSKAVKEIERISKLCKEYGIQLLYHNHGYDLIKKVDGVPVLDLILDNIDPDLLKYQPDLGWLALGGGDPVYYLKKYKDRCPVIHLKDYFVTEPTLLESPFVLGTERGGAEYNYFEFRPSGFGVMNFPALMPHILACEPEWITTDHDMSYERDTYKDMAMSLTYIKQLISLYN